jgi:hypothetical protein
VGSHVIYAAVLLPDPLKFALLADLHFFILRLNFEKRTRNYVLVLRLSKACRPPCCMSN